MFLLDTNVVSELRRVEKADRKVLAWASSAPLASIFLSVVTVLELEFGALSVERRDKAQGLVLRSWIDDQILPRFEGRVVPIDTPSRCVAPNSMCRTLAPNATRLSPRRRLCMA